MNYIQHSDLGGSVNTLKELTALLFRKIHTCRAKAHFGYVCRLSCCVLLGCSGLILAAPGSTPASPTAGFWYGHGHAKAVQTLAKVASINYDYDTDFWFDADDNGNIDGFAIMRCAISLDDHKLRNLVQWAQKMAGAATESMEATLRSYLSQPGGDASTGAEPAQLPAPAQPVAPTKPPLQLPVPPTTKPPLQLPSNPGVPVAAAVAPATAGEVALGALTSPLGSSLGQLDSLIRLLVVGTVVGLRLDYDGKMPVISGKIKGRITGNQVILSWVTSPQRIPFTTLREDLTGDVKIGGGQAPAINPWATPAAIQSFPNGVSAAASGDNGQLTLYWNAARVQPRRPAKPNFQPAKFDAGAWEDLWRPPTTGHWYGRGHARGVQNPTAFTVTNWDYDSDFWFNIDDKGSIDGVAVMRCAISLDDHKLRDLIAKELKEASERDPKLEGPLSPIGSMLQGAVSPNTVGLRLNYDKTMPIIAGKIKGQLTKDGEVTLDWATPPQAIPFTDRREELTLEPKIGGGRAPVINPFAKSGSIQRFKNGVAVVASGENKELALSYNAVRVQPPCPSYIEGESDGGPGVWGQPPFPQNGPMALRGRPYQQQITGAPIRTDAKGTKYLTEYLVPASWRETGVVAFDGYDCRVLLDAKRLLATIPNKRPTSTYDPESGKPEDTDGSFDGLVEQASDQFGAAMPTETPIEWHVPSDDRKKQLEHILSANSLIDIKIVVTPDNSGASNGISSGLLCPPKDNKSKGTSADGCQPPPKKGSRPK